MEALGVKKKQNKTVFDLGQTGLIDIIADILCTKSKCTVK